MATATFTNDKPRRKQLSDQLDRLDDMLDGLSEALNGAVADAAREGVRLAVKEAIVEIMTDPHLRAKLHQASAPLEAKEDSVQQVKRPGFWTRLKARAGQTVAAVGRQASDLVDGAVHKVQAVAEAAAEGARTLRSLGSLKKLALVGLCVGVAVGVASFLAPHVVAAAVSGISCAVAAAAVQVGVWTRRAFRALTIA